MTGRFFSGLKVLGNVRNIKVLWNFLALFNIFLNTKLWIRITFSKIIKIKQN